MKIINSFSRERAKTSEDEEIDSQIDLNLANENTNINSVGENNHEKVYQYQKEPTEVAQINEIKMKSKRTTRSERKPSFVKNLQNIKTNKRRKRKGTMLRRNSYKKRKDVQMKGILRKFRKFYQEEYANFNRAQVLQNSSESDTDQNGFPFTLAEENAQQLTNESLRSFAKHMFKKTHKFGDLMFYIGKPN